MKKSTLSLIVAAAAVLMSQTALAGSDVSGAKKGAQPEAFSAGLKLLKTYFETNNANGTALASGFNVYGSAQTVNCTVSAGCYILVNANAQVAAAAAINPSAIVIKVDGTTINAPFNTPVSTSSFTVMTYQTGIAVPVGNHTVTTEVYVTSATTLHRYNTEVKLYK
jgi:hypothetical protein